MANRHGDNRPDATNVTAEGGFRAWYPDTGHLTVSYDSFNEARRAAYHHMETDPDKARETPPEIYEGQDTADGRPVPGRVPVGWYMPTGNGGRGRWCKSPDWYRDLARRNTVTTTTALYDGQDGENLDVIRRVAGTF